MFQTIVTLHSKMNKRQNLFDQLTWRKLQPIQILAWLGPDYIFFNINLHACFGSFAANFAALYVKSEAIQLASLYRMLLTSEDLNPAIVSLTK
jgi:hypothetical protein